MRASISRRPLRKRRGPHRRSRQLCRTADKRPPFRNRWDKICTAISGLAADAWRPQRDARARVSGSTPNPDRAGGAGSNSWPEVRTRTAGWRQRRDSTGGRHRLNQRSHSRKASRNSCDGSRQPASTGRRPATAPADWKAAVSAPLEVPPTRLRIKSERPNLFLQRLCQSDTCGVSCHKAMLNDFAKKMMPTQQGRQAATSKEAVVQICD